MIPKQWVGPIMLLLMVSLMLATGVAIAHVGA